MTILDANLLLYAYNADAPQQGMAAEWRRPKLPPTASRPFHSSPGASEAKWLAQPGVVALHPGPRHREILEKLVVDHCAIGPLVTDAVLAALAIEYGASLAPTDHNFRRFPDLRWLNPLGA